jgi:glycerophosphoryl diester phosphodiesterase
MLKFVLSLGLTYGGVNSLTHDAPWFERPNNRPAVISHRGSMGHGLEHTIASFTDAWLHGGDWMELDV